jgi:hypothetical protein
MTNAKEQRERQLDVRSANGTRVCGTGPTRDAARGRQGGFKPQPVSARASVLRVISCLTSELMSTCASGTIMLKASI